MDAMRLFEPEASCGSAGLTEDADLAVPACASGIQAGRSSRSVPATDAARGAASRWLRSQRSPRGASRPTLFALEQALALYAAYWQNAWACDARIEAILKQLSLRRGRTLEAAGSNSSMRTLVRLRCAPAQKGPAASRAVMRNKAQTTRKRPCPGTIKRAVFGETATVDRLLRAKQGAQAAEEQTRKELGDARFARIDTDYA